jgi:hypothetical protein
MGPLWNDAGCSPELITVPSDEAIDEDVEMEQFAIYMDQSPFSPPLPSVSAHHSPASYA